MKILITMNMPSRNGNQVHQIASEVDCENIEQFRLRIEENAFITVMELYRNDRGKLFRRGEIILNTEWIGKVKEFDDDIDKSS